MKGLAIDATLMKPDEKEIVEDLVVTAHADAPPQGGGPAAGKDAGA